MFTMCRMNGYTKLFSDILTSTIWQAPNDCRVLWITMLALKDKKSICRATLPALAKLSNISIEDCETYLSQFQSPDKYSRSQDFEGRRIKLVDGGWLILNGEKYRDLLRSDERREYIRKKVAEHRVNKCKQSKQSKPIADPDPDPDLRKDQHSSVDSPQQAADPCPHQDIISLYHEILPMCPKVRVWHASRQRTLRVRWHEHPYLKWWEGYFKAVSECEFLLGRRESSNGRTFIADLEWLIKQGNMTKVHEGKYYA